MGSAAAAGGRSDNFQGRKSTISSCQLHLSVSFMSCMCICICQLYLYCGLVCMILSSFESVVSFCVTCVENLSSLKSKFHITAAPKLLSREVFLPADTLEGGTNDNDIEIFQRSDKKFFYILSTSPFHLYADLGIQLTNRPKADLAARLRICFAVS